MDLFQYIGSIGGIAGVLAFAIFLIYRQDRKASEDRLTGIIKEYNDAAHAHTSALTELITWLKAKNGNK